MAILRIAVGSVRLWRRRHLYSFVYLCLRSLNERRVHSCCMPSTRLSSGDKQQTE